MRNWKTVLAGTSEHVERLRTLGTRIRLVSGSCQPLCSSPTPVVGAAGGNGKFLVGAQYHQANLGQIL